jgi:phosphoserine phosphatase RsbU/P
MLIRSKILIVLITLSALIAGFFLWFAVRIFEKDKKAYVFDSALSLSRNLISQVDLELEGALGIVPAVIQGYEPVAKVFHEISRELFESSHTQVIQIWEQENEKPWAISAELTKIGTTQDWTLPQEPWTSLSPGKSLVQIPKNSANSEQQFLVLTIGIKPTGTLATRALAVAYLPTSIFEHVLESSGAFSSYLMTTGDVGSLISQNIPDSGGANKSMEADLLKIIQDLLAKKSKVGTVHEVVRADRKKYLLGLVQSDKFDLGLISTLPDSVAMAATKTLNRQTGYLFGIVVFASLLFGLFASGRITGALTKLAFATEKVANGDLETQVNVSGKDEISSLGRSFQKMIQEIKRLLKETAEKARMQSELDTARTVQETLFPAPTESMGTVRVAGKYRSASECGGDWWYYWDSGEKAYIWIADATGHGVPAALITSASCAAVAVLRHYQEKSLIQIAQAMNYAISETSRGQRMLTMFLAEVDKASGLMTYVNASHMAAVILPPVLDDGAKWTDLNMVSDPINPRLGENVDSKYTSGAYQLNHGDRVLLVTDGLFDITNMKGDAIGERRFWGRFLKWYQTQDGKCTPLQIAEEAHDISNKHSEGNTPVDDITTVVFDYLREPV